MPATKSRRAGKSPAKSPAKSPRKKFKTPGYQSADALRAVPPPSDDEGPTSLNWFPDAQPGDRVRVMRLDEQSKRWSTHGYFTAGEDTDEHVAELWGGGRYWGQWLRRNTLGTEQIIGSQRPVIPGVYKPPRETYGIKSGESTTAGASPIVGRIPDGVNVKEFLDNVILARSLDALEQRKPVEPVPVVQSSFDRLLDALAPLLPEVIKAMLGRTNPNEGALLRAVEELGRKLDKPAPTPTQGAMSELIDGLKGLTQVREMLMGDDVPKREGEGPMWDVAKKALDVFTGQNSMRQLPPGASPDAPPAAEQLPPWQRLLLEYKTRLVDSAQRGIEPELVAELVARYVPDTQRGILLELVQQPNVGDLIKHVIPAMQNFPTWLDTFVTACRAELLGEEPEEPETPDA